VETALTLPRRRLLPALGLGEALARHARVKR